MSSSAVLRGAIRTRDHDHPPAEKLTHPHTRRIPLHREVEHRSAKHSSAGAPTAGLHSTSVVAVGFGGPVRRRGQEKSPHAQPRARGEFPTMYPVSGDGRESSQTVHRESGTMHQSCASQAHIWHVGGVAVLGCRARYKSHITRHINNIALCRHTPHINAR